MNMHNYLFVVCSFCHEYVNSLHAGGDFSLWHVSYFSQKQVLVFHVNYLFRRQIFQNVKPYLLRKIWKKKKIIMQSADIFLFSMQRVQWLYQTLLPSTIMVWQLLEDPDIQPLKPYAKL